MTSLSFQDIVRIGSGHGIVLCRSVSGDGQPFFHYVKAKRMAIEQMHRDYAAKKVVDFASYGEIVHSGWGANPSEDDIQFIRNKFPS